MLKYIDSLKRLARSVRRRRIISREGIITIKITSDINRADSYLLDILLGPSYLLKLFKIV